MSRTSRQRHLSAAVPEPTDAELADDVARGATGTRRQARRRRHRLQGAALARRGHQGREARRAHRRLLAAARRRSSAWRCCWSSCSGRGSTSPTDREGEFVYTLATPLYGLTFGLSILAIGIGAVLFQKKFIPEEITIQDRHDGASAEIHRKTVVANLTDALEGSTIKRRKLIGAVAGPRPRRVRPRHPGRVRRRPDQEPVEAGGADRRRQEGRAVDVRLDPALRRRDHLPGPRHRSARRLAVHQDAPRGPRRRRYGDGVPVA